MLKFFRNPIPSSVAFLFLFTIGIKLWAFAHPVLPQAQDYQLVWSWILDICALFLGKSALAFTIFAALNVVLQALLINHIADKYRLYHYTTFLPAMSYVLLTSIISYFNFFSAGLVANWFIILSLRLIFSLEGKDDMRKQAFNIGLLLSLAALIEPPYLAMLPGVIIAIISLGSYKRHDWLVTLAGFITPLYFYAAALFVTGHTALYKSFDNFSFTYPLVFKNLSPLIIAAGILILWGIAGAYYLSIYLQKMLLPIKKLWGIIILLSVCAGISTIFSFGSGIHVWMIALVYLSFIFANPFYETNRKWLVNSLFYIIVAITIIIQWWGDSIIFIH